MIIHNYAEVINAGFKTIYYTMKLNKFNKFKFNFINIRHMIKDE